MLLKRGTSGHLPLLPATKAVVDEVMSASLQPEPSGKFGVELAAVAQAKKATLFAAGSAAQKFRDAIKDEQEVLMHISNMVMDAFGIDTAVCRLTKRNPNTASAIHGEAARTFINDAMARLEFSGRQVLAAVSEGDTLRAQLGGLRRLLRWSPTNTVRSRQQIAEYLIDNGCYAL
jgi:butyryl-CoA dehydrogenase